MADAWTRLEKAFDARRDRPVPFWWRDDDAVDATPALDRLLSVVAGRPLALAVIPAALQPALPARLATAPAVTVLQHGWAHRSHAPAGEKKAELGAHRPLDVMAAELAEGRARLTAAFGTRFLHVMVPPWNRMTPALLPRLRALGFVGWSSDRQRAGEAALPALHAGVDPIDWRGRAGAFAGTTAALDQLVMAVGGAAPVGLLTHHLVVDAPGWAFLERLSALLATHPGVAWRSAARLLGRGGEA